MSSLPILCLMGPTASGKTALAIEIATKFHCDIISVDSALVYKGMDIGTAKPDLAIRQLIPHALIDILEPSEAYSAGRFLDDVEKLIAASHAKCRIPLLVGGTMLYFNTLRNGLATLPPASISIRSEIEARAAQSSWQILHQELQNLDPQSAAKIKPNDKQRIQRALEVLYSSGKTLTEWQAKQYHPFATANLIWLCLYPDKREELHQRIAIRLESIMQQGFVEEVKELRARGDLHMDLPSQRAVGYRQAWEYLDGKSTHAEFVEKTLIATRQLAKRQLTWLKAWDMHCQADFSQPQQIVSYLEKEVFSK